MYVKIFMVSDNLYRYLHGNWEKYQISDNKRG